MRQVDYFTINKMKYFIDYDNIIVPKELRENDEQLLNKVEIWFFIGYTICFTIVRDGDFKSPSRFISVCIITKRSRRGRRNEWYFALQNYLSIKNSRHLRGRWLGEQRRTETEGDNKSRLRSNILFIPYRQNFAYARFCHFQLLLSLCDISSASTEEFTPEGGSRYCDIVAS